MTNVKVLSAKETMAIKGGLLHCTLLRPCPTGYCCNLDGHYDDPTYEGECLWGLCPQP
ncbi:MAG: hypothetical protein WDO14_21405 [Bacteroidota bacterium]